MAKGPKKILWGSEHKDEIKYHNFGSIMSQPTAMYDWINGNNIDIVRFTGRIFRYVITFALDNVSKLV